MSNMVRNVKEARMATVNREVVNFMGGTSYKVDPLTTLKIVTSSSIFGEPQYYRNGEFKEKGITDGCFDIDKLLSTAMLDEFKGLKTSDLMEKIIDEALDYDFEGTLQWAVTLRKDFLMRLNPQVIMVRASMHKGREEFTNKNNGLFNEINTMVMSRLDEPASQLAYWLYRNSSKNKLPSVLKRSWADRLKNASRYEMYKYKNKGLGIIDVIRISHANNELIDELMKTGTISVPAEELTWETLKATGKSWDEILKTIKLPHMALLRNLRGIFEEIEDIELCKKLMEDLKGGVLKGKQFPFRYMTAKKFIESSEANHKMLIIDALEECMDIAIDNMPKLKGRTMCLSDNSGSAWGTINSEYGTVTVGEIDNLSSVITSQNSDEGFVGKFGDKLKVFPISSRRGTLEQTEELTRNKYNDVGGSTENGIWLFFDKAIKDKEHWDNIFIYSDQQAGHGGLYGVNPSEYSKYNCHGRYIDVAKLIDTYRRKVNPKVNVFSVQTAGYDNVVVPENLYRTSILYGWTGKELVYADAINKLWDEVDAKNS